MKTRWSAFGQTDLVENDQLAGEKWIYIDGAAGTPMYHWQTLRTATFFVACRVADCPFRLLDRVPVSFTLRMVHQFGLGKYTYIMWGANALASVAGSIIVMMISIRWGFTEAVTIGGLTYLLAAILIVVLTYK